VAVPFVGLKKFSNWPTYPQLYVEGDLVGGLDIIKVGWVWEGGCGLIHGGLNLTILRVILIYGCIAIALRNCGAYLPLEHASEARYSTIPCGCHGNHFLSYFVEWKMYVSPVVVFFKSTVKYNTAWEKNHWEL